MNAPDYTTFSMCMLTDKIYHINSMLNFNAAVIQQLQQRVQSLIDLNETIAQQLQLRRLQEHQTHHMIEESAPEQRIMESIFSKREYKFHLILKKSLKMPLYKQRNFNLFLGVFDEDHHPVVNAISIPLKFEVYTSGSKPQLIEVNKQSNPILKGNCQSELTLGNAAFNKLSIRQVSSKFERGLVTIIVSVDQARCNSDSDINWREIRPLLIKDVLIRAKKN